MVLTFQYKMQSAQYLIRFDDICPTMNWEIWNRVEKILIEYDVKPILAVVPDNKDLKLEVDSPREDFWERVRQWQQLGWAIGLHGYQHVYETTESGIVGINNRSEFAGLPREIQYKKIKAGLDIFHSHGVRADLWVAPGHSFDSVTVEVLQSVGLNILSDGYFLRPLMMGETYWIPQQLWRFRLFLLGTWTVCFHTNAFKSGDIIQLENSLRRFKKQIVGLSDIMEAGYLAQRNIGDQIFSMAWRMIIYGKRFLSQLLHKVI